MEPEKYLREVWPIITRALKEVGVGCELNLVGALAGRRPFLFSNSAPACSA